MTDEYGLKDHVKIGYNVPFWEWPEGKSASCCCCGILIDQTPSSRKLGMQINIPCGV
jgi:hypothetical protein